MAKSQCTDRVVGAILASWRYDISGISPEMRRDYEQHFADCSRCRARLQFHRSLDVSLVVLTSLSVFFSLFALAVLRHIKPLEHVAFNVLGLDIADTYHMLVSAAVAGVCFSVIAFVLVLTATPVPSYLGGIARGTGPHPRRAAPRRHQVPAAALKRPASRVKRPLNWEAAFVSCHSFLKASGPADRAESGPLPYRGRPSVFVMQALRCRALTQ